MRTPPVWALLGVLMAHSPAEGLTPNPAWTAESDLADARFGFSVASAGDVNGDGYDDVIVGAHQYGNGETFEGGAFVYLGSASGLGAAPAWTAEGGQAGAQLGYAVAGAGDVNGDGYDDVIIGAPGYDNGERDEGRAFVYLGSAGGLGAGPVWTGESNQRFSNYGTSVATAGDVNGDGRDDIIVGIPYFDNGHPDQGRAHVYLGSAAGVEASPSWTAEESQDLASFGMSVATAGDVNGDGFDDVIVGAPGYEDGQTGEGRASMYLGSATGLSSGAAWMVESDHLLAKYGNSVGTAGDVNGDGYDDLMVGAPGYDGDRGAAFLYLGSASGPDTGSDWTALSDQQSQFGRSLARAGDLNGDGFDDAIVGAAFHDNEQADEGGAFIYAGSASGPGLTAAWTAESDQDDAQFGTSVAAAGDVNGDGYDDLIVGAAVYDNGQVDEGGAFLYLGSATMLCVPPDQPVVIDLVWLSVETGFPVIDVIDLNEPARVTGYNVYRSSDPAVPPVLWPPMGLDVVDEYPALPNVQCVDETAEEPPVGSAWFYQVTANNNVCGEGPF